MTTPCPNCERLIPADAPHCECGVDPVRLQAPRLPRHECWAIQYLRPDGTEAGRTDYYRRYDAAIRSFRKSVSIHGPYSNGAPRWRLLHMAQVSEIDLGELA